MQEHHDHHAAADTLTQSATSAGIHDLAHLAALHAVHSEKAAAAYATGDNRQKAAAVARLALSYGGLLDAAASATSLPINVEHDVENVSKAFAVALAASH